MTLSTFRAPQARVLAAVTAAALLFLTGCSDDTDSDPAGSAEPGESVSTDQKVEGGEGTTQYPLVLTTAWGETELTERPERIAAVSPTARDVELLALLKVTPVVAAQPVERAIWTLEALEGDIEVIYEGDHTGITPHEQVAAANPDLIVVFGKSIADEHDQLAAIAPIVGPATEEAATEADWESELRAIAEALDLQDRAEQVISENEEYFANIREEKPEFSGLTATYLVQYSAEYGLSYFSTPGSDTEELFLDLGFDANPLAEQFTSDSNVSSELIAQVDADVLVIANNTGDEAELERLLTGSELFQNLSAVQNDTYAVLHATETGYIFDGDEHEGNLAWALAAGGPLGKQWAAEHLLPALVSAVN